MNKTGAEHLVDVLAELGTEVAFGLPGVHNLPIWEAVAGSGIRMIGVRHEQTAGYAADGYARATGKLGVAVVTTRRWSNDGRGWPDVALAANVLATRDLLRLAEQHAVECVIYPSSDKSVLPRSVYGASKRLAELVVSAFADAHLLIGYTCRRRPTLGRASRSAGSCRIRRAEAPISSPAR